MNNFKYPKTFSSALLIGIAFISQITFFDVGLFIEYIDFPAFTDFTTMFVKQFHACGQEGIGNILCFGELFVLKLVENLVVTSE